MKKISSILMLSLIILSTLPILTPQVKADSGSIIFQDDFEGYDVGTFPSSGGWELVWNGRGDDFQRVVDSRSFSGTKSLQLWGSPGWSAVAQKKFSTTSQKIGYEFAILIESIGTGGPGRVEHPGFFNREGYVWGKYYATVKFNHDDMKIYDETYGETLGTWEPGTWYAVKVILDRGVNKYDVWINGEMKGVQLDTQYSDTDLINALALVSDHAGVKVYYDDVKVFEAYGELVSLPAGAKNIDSSNLELDETRLLIDVDIAGSGQTAYVDPGETVSGILTYQIYSGAGNPYEINQGFFIMSWTPSWPAPSGYYIPIWNGISGVYPGVTNTESFSFTAPSTSGTYYLYWCGGAEYSMADAVVRYDQPLTIPAHAKIVVGGNLAKNPGFEQQLDYWSVSMGTATYTADTSDPRSGSYCAKGVEFNEGSLGRLYQDMTGIVYASGEYRISGWIKTQDVVGYVVIALDYVDDFGVTPADGYVKEIGYVTGTAGWTYYESGVFTLPPMPSDASGVWFLFDFNAGKGTAWWDDVSLIEVTPPPTQKPVAELSASPTTVEIWEDVFFDASASYDPDGSVVSYWFDFGDGFDSGWTSSSTYTRSYTDPGTYYAKAKVKDNDGLVSDWSDPVSITVAPVTLAITFVSAIWKDETDGMVTPYDHVKIEFKFKNNLDKALQDVKISYAPDADIISDLTLETDTIGDVSPGSEFNSANTIKITGVEDPTIYIEIIQEEGDVPLTDSISIVIEYTVDTTTSSQAFTVTPTDEASNTLYIQYPDFSSIAGEDPSATETEKDFYRQGDALYHHPSNYDVRKYAVKAGTYQTGNIYGVFPDIPTDVAYNTYRYVNELLDPKRFPDVFYNDVMILGWVDAGLMDIDKPYLDPYVGEDGEPDTGDEGHICIEHAYLFTSLARTLGFQARELTVALGTIKIGPIIWYGYQEAASQVWYDDNWNFYDPFMELTNIDDYLQGYVAYRAWYAFSEEPLGHDFSIRAINGEPASKSQWKHLKDGHKEGLIITAHSPVVMLITDGLGRRVGTTMEGTIVNEIPRAIYVPPNSFGYTDASDPASLVHLDEMIFIPNMSRSDEYLLDIVGISEGPYTVTFGFLQFGEVTNPREYSGETVADAVYTYSIDTTNGGLIVKPNPIDELEHLKEFIDRLSDEVFDKPRLASQRKNALFNKIDEVILKVEAGNYTDAINKLLHDIRAKTDGDSTAEDWVTDPETQASLCIIIDHIISSIETLQQA